MKNRYLLLCALLIGTAGSLRAQDLRERTYYYEILEPRHEPKPEVNGFATKRIKRALEQRTGGNPCHGWKKAYILAGDCWNKMMQMCPSIYIVL